MKYIELLHIYKYKILQIPLNQQEEHVLNHPAWMVGM